MRDHARTNRFDFEPLRRSFEEAALFGQHLEHRADSIRGLARENLGLEYELDLGSHTERVEIGGDLEALCMPEEPRHRRRAIFEPARKRARARIQRNHAGFRWL